MKSFMANPSNIERNRPTSNANGTLLTQLIKLSAVLPQK